MVTRYEIAHIVRFHYEVEVTDNESVQDHVRSQVLFPDWLGLYEHIDLIITKIDK